MPRNALALFIIFALLSANLFSVDFDGAACEGKGVETAELYFPSVPETAATATIEAGKTARDTVKPAPAGERKSVFAFEVPFTLIVERFTPAPHAAAILPHLYGVPHSVVLSEPLTCLPLPRGPPRTPTDLRFVSLRAPPSLSLTQA